MGQKIQILVLGVAAFWAAATQAESTVGSLPASAPQSSVIGEMPYTNQWKFELPSSFLWLSIAQQKLRDVDLSAGGYTGTFPSSRVSYPSLDYFVRTADLGSRLGLWTHYGLGIGVKDGKLRNNEFTVSNGGESSSLLLAAFRLGPTVQWEAWQWLRPYVGVHALIQGYRMSTSLSGSETQGYGLDAEPCAGLLLAPSSLTRLSLFVEGRHNFHWVAKTQMMAESTDLSAGMGFSF